jgi:hypothetical protein
MTLTNTTNNNAATHELSIEELGSVAGGTTKGFVDSVLGGALLGGIGSCAAGPEAVPAGVIFGAFAGAAAYVLRQNGMV